MLKITFKHFHEGNDPYGNGRLNPKTRKRAPYATRCRVVDTETGDVVVETRAFCSKKDAPTRGIGREVSGGRALKTLDHLGIKYDRSYFREVINGLVR